MRTLYLLTIVILTSCVSSYFTQQRCDETIKQRAYAVWGEGDAGEEIAWYLTTGDTSSYFWHVEDKGDTCIAEL